MLNSKKCSNFAPRWSEDPIKGKLNIKMDKIMKKIFYAVICLLLPVVASAQVIVGGTIDFSAKTSTRSSYYDEYESLDKSPTSFSFGIAPKVGYIINNKWEVGAKLNLHSYQETRFVTLLDEERKNPKAFKDMKMYNFKWSIQPYARWSAVEVKGFGLWIEGMVSLGSTIDTKTKYYAAKYGENGDEHRSAAEAERLNNQTTYGNSSYFEGGLYIQPVLTYKITEHFRLETALNFLGFNLSGTSSKTIVDDNGNWSKRNTCDFGLNINSENIAQIGYLTISCVYAF